MRLVEDRRPTKAEVMVEETRYVESDTALISRILGREVGGKQNILVLNDEAHHAYRIVQAAPEDEVAEDAEALDEDAVEEFVQEATVWVDGLDRIHRAPRDQPLRRPLCDAVLSCTRRAGHESDLPLGRERLRADGRDRIRAREDPSDGLVRSQRGGAGQ